MHTYLRPLPRRIVMIVLIDDGLVLVQKCMVVDFE